MPWASATPTTTRLKQFAHGAGHLVATPQGVVSRYLLRRSSIRRRISGWRSSRPSSNRLGSVTDQLLLLCYHYDPTTGRYGAAVMNAIRVGFIATVAASLTFAFVSLRRERANARAEHHI